MYLSDRSSDDTIEQLIMSTRLITTSYLCRIGPNFKNHGSKNKELPGSQSERNMLILVFLNAHLKDSHPSKAFEKGMKIPNFIALFICLAIKNTLYISLFDQYQ